MTLSQISDGYASVIERQRFVPNHYRKNEIDVSDISGFDKTSWVKRSTQFKTPVWKFSYKNKTILASKPISIEIKKGEAHFFAENENLGIYSIGESYNCAIKAFCEELIYFYNHYKNLPWTRVTGEAKRLKKLYEELFLKNK